MSFREYVEAGWKLCAIRPGSKSPDYDAWNTKPVPLDAAEGLDGAGLLHALSGTCALDIDNLDLARPWLAERGVDVDALIEAPDSVRIESGRPGRNKLLYCLSRPLRTLRPKRSGIELRCATGDGKSVQDVLPPSVHPDTKKPYAWAYGEPLTGDWAAPPAIPAALLALWRELLAEEPAEAPAKPVAEAPSVTLDKLQRWLGNYDPNLDYEEWLKVGMKLHDATGGAAEGLALWDTWSAKATRKSKDGSSIYPGSHRVKSHWVSFSSGKGKFVATLTKELPADAEEFPVEDPEAAESEEGTTADKLKASARQVMRDAIEALEKRLVFVYSAERYFDCERHRIINSDSAIEHMFTGLMPSRKGGRVSPIKVLKASNTKRFVDAVAFHPGQGAIFHHKDESFANTYRDRLAEPIEPTAGELEKIHWLFNRIDDGILREWLVKFYAHVVQKPGIKIKSAPLIWSEIQGNGKTTLLKMIPSLLCGDRYSREVNCALLGDNFNGYLMDAWHVNLVEFRAGTRGERNVIMDKIKNWVTEDTVSVRPMHQTAYMMPNHFFLTATSNHDDAAAIDNNDRRLAIHEMHAPQFTEAEQLWIYNEFLLQPRAAGVLRHFFLHQSIEGFIPSAKAPETEARREMIRSSVSSDLELLERSLEERSGLFARDIVLTSEVKEFIHKNTPMRPSLARVGKLLCRDPFNGKGIQFRVGPGRFRAVVLRDYAKWSSAGGAAVMAHINGEDADLTA